MAAIYLLRHGQASFGARDYDRLAPTGVLQARYAGEALAGCGLRDLVLVSGGMQRHRDSLRECAAAMGASGETLVDVRWNEYDHRQIISAAFPEYAEEAQLRAALSTTTDPHAAFQRLFDQAMSRWIGGAHDADYAESWTVFRQRVQAALDAVVQAIHSGRDALVSTSGGPIAAIVQRLLSLPDAQTVGLAWSIVNASVTKLLVGRRAVRLSSFNVHVHLEQAGPNLVTYR